MIKTITGTMMTAALLAFAPAPVQAQTMMECSDANMTSAMGAVDKMASGEKKTEAMKQMMQARESMSKKDMAACKTHLNNVGVGDMIQRDGQSPK